MEVIVSKNVLKLFPFAHKILEKDFEKLYTFEIIAVNPVEHNTL